MFRKRTLRMVLALTIAFSAGGGVGVAAASWSSAKTASHTVGTATLAPPTNVSASGDVTLGWTATTSTWATGTRVFRAASSGGTYSQIAEIAGPATTTYSDAPGAGAVYYRLRSYYTGKGANWESVDTSVVSRATPTFMFKSTAAYTGSSATCLTAQVDRDMEQGITPAGPEETWTRTGGSGSVTFCSDTFNTGVGAGQTVAAGTTTVNAYFDNTSGSPCSIGAVLMVNGTTLLGSGNVTIPAFTNAGTLFSWSFATTAHTFVAGERLNFFISWGGTKSCASTDLFYGAAVRPSSVTVPTIS